MSDKRNVLVISGNSLFREGLRRVLEDHPEFELLEVAASLDQAIEISDQVRPDVIIFDGEADPEFGPELSRLFELSPEQLVSLSMTNSKMTIFSRRQVLQATVEDLIESIQQSKS